MNKIKTIILLPLILFLTACSSTAQQNRQATYTSAGAATGASIAHVLGADKAITLLSGLLGGGIGYYASLPSLKKVKASGGESFQVGDSITIIIPSDALFDPATTDLAKHADTVLNDLATYLSYYPHKNILVTVNTSNIGTKKFEDTLSGAQAAKIAHFLETQGINSVDGTREMRYAGLGSREPISSMRSAKGLYENRRVQITLYPDSRATTFTAQMRDENIGAPDQA